VEADNKSDHAEKKTEDPPVSKTNHSIGEAQNSHKEPKRKFWSIVKVAFYPFRYMDSVGFFTAVLCFVAWLQWQTFEKTDRTLRDTLDSTNITNRPFVFAKGVTIDPNIVRGYWTFAIPIENSGNTPTREMDSLTISGLVAPSDPEEVFIRTPKSAYDAPGTIPQRWPGSLLGPKAQAHLLGSQTGMPAITISKMADDRQNYYISGVIHYRDAFAGTPEHITKFFYAIIPFKEGTETRVNYDRCLYWNCADEDCKTDRERWDHDLKIANMPKKLQ
jgi:hypothetical protein